MENIENKDLKKEWKSPILYILDFRKTKNGPEAGSAEDTYENNPVTGSTPQ